MLITELINNSDHHGAGRRMLSLALMKTPVVWEKNHPIRSQDSRGETELRDRARRVYLTIERVRELEEDMERERESQDEDLMEDA